MTPTYCKPAERLALAITRHADAIVAAAGLLFALASIIAALELLPAFRLL